MKRAAFFIALAILVSLVLHEVHFNHDHSKVLFGEKIEAVTHGTDKKWWLMAMLSAMSAVFAGSLMIAINETRSGISLTPSRNNMLRSLSPLNHALRRGIIHSKID